MSKVNINDPESLKALYPLSAFEEDAARNAVADTQVVHGIRIESGPDAEGWFRCVRAQRHVGEQTHAAGLPFVAPNEPHIAANLVGAEPDAAPSAADARRTRQEEYDSFIDRVAETARTSAFQEPIGEGEERLKGFHGG
jgi:hypothetical protein